MTQVCPKCGKENDIKNNYCDTCGTLLDSSNAPIGSVNNGENPNISEQLNNSEELNVVTPTSNSYPQNNIGNKPQNNYNQNYNQTQGQNYSSQPNYNYNSQGYSNNSSFNSNIAYMSASNRIKGSLMFLYVFNIIVSTISIFVGIYIIAQSRGYGGPIGFLFFIIPIPCYVIASVAGRAHEFIKNLDNTINQR